MQRGTHVSNRYTSNVDAISIPVIESSDGSVIKSAYIPDTPEYLHASINKYRAIQLQYVGATKHIEDR